ncbi:hypothetical protein PIB30_053571 [Stylosanthes scabra]|uniref:Uncharacterized protein n=1 Tax=Stylosanthes scabra TaxID=79078 RepID=A0ABU6RIM1_9FABA|nr:hypothetical protein [Stylosanthes scabra]
MVIGDTIVGSSYFPTYGLEEFLGVLYVMTECVGWAGVTGTRLPVRTRSEPIKLVLYPTDFKHLEAASIHQHSTLTQPTTIAQRPDHLHNPLPFSRRRGRPTSSLERRSAVNHCLVSCDPRSSSSSFTPLQSVILAAFLRHAVCRPHPVLARSHVVEVVTFSRYSDRPLRLFTMSKLSWQHQRRRVTLFRHHRSRLNSSCYCKFIINIHLQVPPVLIL